MHVIFKKIRARITTMSIKNGKVATFGPFSFIIRLGYIHDNGYSVFIIVFDHSVVSINRITFDKAISFFDEIDVINFGNLVDFLRLKYGFHIIDYLNKFLRFNLTIF